MLIVFPVYIVRKVIINSYFLAIPDKNIEALSTEFKHPVRPVRQHLDNIINPKHRLCRLSELIDWSVFDERFSELYCAGQGCPGKPTRLMVGLQMLKHMLALSDAEVVSQSEENPYW